MQQVYRVYLQHTCDERKLHRCKNLTNPIPEADGINIPEKSLEKFNSFMSNSFGFGGTNVSLVLSKYEN